MQVPKSIIYYTDCRVEEPILSAVQKFITASGLPVVSTSLNKPIDFGKNFVVEGVRSYPTMVNQIVKALENSESDYVFFCEHDVLYHKCHFDFTPPTNDTYYYNMNDWRWDYPNDRLIRYDGLSSLSQLCCSTKLALDHYKRRQARIAEIPEQFPGAGESHRQRAWGYEPGTKRTGNGGFSDEKFDKWYSPFPNIDIRHNKTYSIRKTRLTDFHHQPTGWVETTMNKIDGWDLKGIL
jgi:hypothetical protein